jgi:ribosomal-protein-alanine N-acetyltransferase
VSTDEPTIVLETPRLILRELTERDLGALSAFYADREVMEFMGGARDPSQTLQSLTRIIFGYQQHGFGLWATVRKDDDVLMGRCGLIPWKIAGQDEIEVAYLLGREYWGAGYALEAARAITTYAFERIRPKRLLSLIHPKNKRSQIVAERNGMRYVGDVNIPDIPFRPIRKYTLDAPSPS